MYIIPRMSCSMVTVEPFTPFNLFTILECSSVMAFCLSVSSNRREQHVFDEAHITGSCPKAISRTEREMNGIDTSHHLNPDTLTSSNKTKLNRLARKLYTTLNRDLWIRISVFSELFRAHSVDFDRTYTHKNHYSQ